MVGGLEIALSWPSFFHQPPTRLTARVNPTIYAPPPHSTRDAQHRTVYSRVDPGGQPWGGRLCWGLCWGLCWASVLAAWGGRLCWRPVLAACAGRLGCGPGLGAGCGVSDGHIVII